MRRIITASLLCSSMLFPVAANASKPTDDVSASAPHRRVSSGVVPPTVLNAVDVIPPEDFSSGSLPNYAKVSLSLTVDAKGNAEDIQVVKSINPVWDARVIEAVREFHFRPGTLDKQRIPMDMNLTIEIKR